MIVCRTLSDFLVWRQESLGTVGFVPTMGALHRGHLSLVECSTSGCSTTVVSIYVNPAQFAPTEDLDSYPRHLEKDLQLLRDYQVDAVLFPSDEDMYPEEFSTHVMEKELSSRLDGASRPTHFQGVTTIVAKLFNIVQPDRAFFGEKDAQQLRVIQKMTADLNFGVKIIPCPTVRESNGLAMSSRNEYLSADLRHRAGIIHQALTEAQTNLRTCRCTAESLKEMINARISEEKAAKIDYISVAGSRTLDECSGTIRQEVLVSVAVFFGATRLIDNFTCSPAEYSG